MAAGVRIIEASLMVNFSASVRKASFGKFWQVSFRRFVLLLVWCADGSAFFGTNVNVYQLQFSVCLKCRHGSFWSGSPTLNSQFCRLMPALWICRSAIFSFENSLWTWDGFFWKFGDQTRPRQKHSSLLHPHAFRRCWSAFHLLEFRCGKRREPALLKKIKRCTFKSFGLGHVQVYIMFVFVLQIHATAAACNPWLRRYKCICYLLDDVRRAGGRWSCCFCEDFWKSLCCKVQSWSRWLDAFRWVDWDALKDFACCMVG